MDPALRQENEGAGEQSPRRLFIYNGGFLKEKRIRRILALSGWNIRLGKPKDGDWVGIWGNSPTAHRGKSIAEKTDTPILRVEDAFLRSILPGRDGEPPIGLNLDTRAVHFDPAAPSDLEDLLTRTPLDDAALLQRAKDAIARIQALHLSKYNGFDPALPAPDPGYVLVIDQTKGDASVKASGADRARFQEMLVFAQEEHPGAQILIKTHPETRGGHREGYFTLDDETARVTLYDENVSPWRLLEGARAVYTVSSQLGFEAIFAGHKPRVFGQPFYAGWGLTEDDRPVPRRERKLTRAQLFAAAMILYPRWYDPHRDELCSLERCLDILEAKTRSFREDRAGYVAAGMRLWKRRPLRDFFGKHGEMEFVDDVAKAIPKAADRGVPLLVWAGKCDEAQVSAARGAKVNILRVEDGFLRSRGLGANLVAPLSLVTDDLGIYYDPSRESRLERLINSSIDLPQPALRRSERLIQRLRASGLSKYNLGLDAELDLPSGHLILVPGQVEDDASIQTGCHDVSTNLGLLQAARSANPDAIIIYKPHPDVEAGLRKGAVDPKDLEGLADFVLPKFDPIQLIEAVDEIWTLTSLLGFEALLREKPVVCLGTPFYAGWGLTQDRAPAPQRRIARPTLLQLAHAVLIDYPRYFDPLTGSPCPVETVVERLESGSIPRASRTNRALAKLQGLLSSQAHLWR